MTRRRHLIGLALLIASLGAPQTLHAQTATWVSVKELKGSGSVCLDVSGNQIDYSILGPGHDAQCSIQGPRHLKLIYRYLFAEEDEARVSFTVFIEIDGREVLRKRFTGLPHEQAAFCRNEQRVGQLRRAYVDLPAGRHDITLRAESEGHGQIAVRLFRQVRRQRESWVTFAPERYAELRHLQFDSGNQSVYYQFTAAQPLRMSVTGPTSLRLSTRLDFDHTMNGTQQYSLDVLLDGTEWRTFHFDCIALTSAAYVERPDILPGVRKNLRIQIPSGRHTVEILCLRPDNCSVAAMVHIPKRDVQR